MSTHWRRKWKACSRARSSVRPSRPRSHAADRRVVHERRHSGDCRNRPTVAGTDGCEHARRDLAAAGQLQRMMLPLARVNAGGWNATYRYEPAGAVSGDDVDVVQARIRYPVLLGCLCRSLRRHSVEICPACSGDRERIHWSFEDPTAVQDPEDRCRAFDLVASGLAARLVSGCLFRWFAIGSSTNTLTQAETQRARRPPWTTGPREFVNAFRSSVGRRAAPAGSFRVQPSVPPCSSTFRTSLPRPA